MMTTMVMMMMGMMDDGDVLCFLVALTPYASKAATPRALAGGFSCSLAVRLGRHLSPSFSSAACQGSRSTTPSLLAARHASAGRRSCLWLDTRA